MLSKRAAMAYVKEKRKEIDKEMVEELERRKREAKAVFPRLAPILEAVQELAAGGKRLRGILVLLGYELAGGKVNGEVVRAAVAMELFHLGLLIQDDVMDRDELRRGVATIQTRYEDEHLGEALAMLAGDYTFGWTTEILAGLKLPFEGKQAALLVWGRYFTRVGYGQSLDMLAEREEVGGEKELLRIVQIKSGEYSCVLPLLLGASLAGGKEGLLAELEKYGMELGWVFQLRDDWLAEWGEVKKMGKPVGNDRREGKKTFAILYGREKLEAEIKKHLERGKRLCGLWREFPTQRAEAAVMQGILEWMAEREN